MRGVFGQPWLDLDALVPLHILDVEGINMELALADKYNNLWGKEHADDAIHYRVPPENASERVKEFYRKHGGSQKLMNFIKLNYGVYSPTWVVRLTDMDTSLKGEVATKFQTQVDDPNLWKQRRDTFKSVWEFIDQSGVFASTGRINFFITDHLCPTPEHMDYDHPQSNYSVGHNALAEKQFLYINPTGKSFYIKDEKTGKQYPVTSKCAWFNTLDLHGGNGVKQQAWSLRIDGKFSQSFLRRLEETFGNGLPLFHW